MTTIDMLWVLISIQYAVWAAFSLYFKRELRRVIEDNEAALQELLDQQERR